MIIDINSSANVVLRILLSFDDVEHYAYSDDTIFIQEEFTNNDIVFILDYINSKQTKLINTLVHTTKNRLQKALISAQIKPHFRNGVSNFLSAQGYNKFNDYSDFTAAYF